jgi:hypothetical protein
MKPLWRFWMPEAWLARQTLTPLCERFGLGYDESALFEPRTTEALIVNALRCGWELIDEFTTPDPWIHCDPYEDLPEKFAKGAAKHMRAAFLTDEGREAISCAAQGFARTTADLWFHTAMPRDVNDPSGSTLLGNAKRAEELAELVAQALPVQDPHGVLPRIAHAAEVRMFDVDNPDALINLRDYAARAKTTSDALALAAGDKYEDFERALIGPVMSLGIAYNAERLVAWALATEQLGNLLRPEPLAWVEVSQKMLKRQAEGQLFPPDTPAKSAP